MEDVSLLDRVGVLGPFAPDTHTVAHWASAQLVATSWSFGAAAAVVALCGVVLAAVVSVRSRADEPSDAGDERSGVARLARVALALAGASLLLQVLFWRHTGDPQESFWINSIPTVAVAVALAITWTRSRARSAATRGVVDTLPFVLVALGSHAGLAHVESLRAPGPLDLDGARGPAAPLPRTVGTDVAEIVPTGAVVWYPTSLGLTPAASFYAWRTFLPVAPTASAVTVGAQHRLGLGERPAWLVVPREPSEAQLPEVRALEEELRGLLGGEPDWHEGRLYRAARIGRSR
ncbi:MAG: hypothetical protein R3F34_13630 [Planctomycetota bacterium]